MGRRAIHCLALVIAVSACSANGVTIEVHRGETHAERVELYIVDGYCTIDDQGGQPCPQLKTPSASRYLEGEVYTRKIGDTFEAPVESDGVAYFSIKANGDRTRIPLAVAVGFDGNGTRVGAVLMPHEFYTTDNNRHLVRLEKIVEDRVTGTAQTDGLRAETWYEDPVGCLALEHTSNGTSLRKFIVPADDLDCDGWLPPEECDSIWPHRGATDESTLPFTCVVEKSASGSGKMCLLGDAPCIDGAGAPECAPVETDFQQWCVPSALCDPLLCGDATNPLCLYGALKNPRLPPAAHPSFVHCKIPVQQVTGSALDVCRGDVAISVSTRLSVPGVCNGFSVGPVKATDIGPFNAVYTSPTAAGPIHMVRAGLQDPCTPVLTFSGDFAMNTMLDNAMPDLALKLDVSLSMALIVPLVVELQPMAEAACVNADPICVFVTADDDANGIDESLASCVRDL